MTDLVDAAEQALERGDGWLTIAASPFRQTLEGALVRRGTDLRRARGEGRYLALEARTVLRAVVSRDDQTRPDPLQFRRVLADLMELVRRSGAACGPYDSRHRPVAILTELSALLWDDGFVLGALELDDLLGELLREQGVSLYCLQPEEMTTTGRLSALTTPSLASPGARSREADGVCASSVPAAAPSGVPAGADRLLGHRVVEPKLHPSGTWQVFPAEPAALREVRRFVRSALDGPSAEVMEDACLVATELATNVLRHVGQPFTVAVKCSAGSVHVQVRDASPILPVPRPVPPRAPSGRGMAIVDRLARRWGAEEVGGGKVVWAELAS